MRARNSKQFRRTQTPTRTALRANGVEFHRHYAGSTACSASRATLFTGQYPSLHGVSQTDGISKSNTEVFWLDPNTVPTMGDWFRAGGYRSYYRGKWHISHADLPVIGTHEGLMSSDYRGSPSPRQLRPTSRLIGSSPTASPAGSAGSRMASGRRTWASSATASMQSRSRPCSRNSRSRVPTARGWPSHPSSTRTTSCSRG